MSSGDVITSSYNSTTTSGYTIQAAVGVQIMITAMWSTGNVAWRPTNASGSNGTMEMGTGGSIAPSPYIKTFGSNLKLFFTNSEYLDIFSISGTQSSGYSGIEI